MTNACFQAGPSSRNSESPLVLGSMDMSRPSSDLLQGRLNKKKQNKTNKN